MHRTTIILLFFAFMIVGCNKQKEQFADQKISGYTFYSNNATFKLPLLLREISGLSFIKDGILATIQDEDGILIIYDLSSNEILKKIEFSESGDYEGVAIVGDDAFILQSNGTLHQVSEFDTQNYSVRKINTYLSKNCDAEGLCYDQTNNQLLIACKNSVNKDSKDRKSVFSYDLEKEEILESPAFEIPLLEIQDKLDTDKFAEIILKTWHYINPKGIEGIFSPSGIAIHPIRNTIFILSANNKLILETNRKGDILGVVSFAESLMLQPEGITFSNKGTLYISNEGNAGRQNILQYNYE